MHQWCAGLILTCTVGHLSIVRCAEPVSFLRVCDLRAWAGCGFAPANPNVIVTSTFPQISQTNADSHPALSNMPYIRGRTGRTQTNNKKDGKQQRNGKNFIQNEMDDYAELRNEVAAHLEMFHYIFLDYPTANYLPQDILALKEFKDQFGWLPERQFCCEYCHFKQTSHYGCRRCQYDVGFWNIMAKGQNMRELCNYVTEAEEIEQHCVWCNAAASCSGKARLVVRDCEKMLPQHACGENPQDAEENRPQLEIEFPVDVPAPLRNFTLGDFL